MLAAAASSASPLHRLAVANAASARLARASSALDTAALAVHVARGALAAHGGALEARALVAHIDRCVGCSLESAWRALGYESAAHFFVVHWREHVDVVAEHYARTGTRVFVCARADGNIGELGLSPALADLPRATLVAAALELVRDAGGALDVAALAPALIDALDARRDAYFIDVLATTLVVASGGALVAAAPDGPCARVRLLATNTA